VTDGEALRSRDVASGGAHPGSTLHLLLHALDRLAVAMAYLAGSVLLLASFYITADVIGRRFFGISSKATDEFGGYALAVGGMWALAFALTTDAHVRIDVLLPRFPRQIQSILNYAAMVAMAFFAVVLATYTGKMTVESYTTDARAMSFLRTPLFVPQGLLTLGFAVLAAHASIIFLVGLVDSIRLGRFAPLAVLRVDDVTEGL
jgi:TRAP-type C4-dicarboxylate transport system permease small subunit